MRIISVALMAIVALCLNAQKTFSVLGDSYSTFKDCVTPSYNAVWYFPADDNVQRQNDVHEPAQTWWGLLQNTYGYKLDTNNSYSGSTVCYSGYRNEDYSDRAFITRVHNLGNPDIILIFGGTNDSWANAPFGDFQYANWTKADLYNFRPAFAYLLSSLKGLYPGATIVNISNSELKDEITDSMQTICDHYGIVNLQLKDIDKIEGHPSVAGMKAIAAQLADVLPEPGN